MDRSKWEYKKLGEICSKLTDGSHNPPKGIENSDYRMISSQNIFNDRIVLDDYRCLSKDDFELENRRTALKKGDLLLTIVGAIGRCYVINGTEGNLTLQRSVAALTPKDNMSSRFLMYYFIGNNANLLEEAHGVAQKGIYLRQLSNLIVPIPSIADQQRIVEELDCLNEMIALKQEQLKEFDKLAQSIFYDMFGDPVINEKGWDKCCLEEVLTNLRYGTSTPPQFSENGYKFIRATNIKNGCISESNMFFISEKEAAMLEKCRLSKYDMIIVRSGANAGDVCRIGEEYSGNYAGYDIIFSINPIKADTIFLNSLMNNGVFVSSVIKPLTRRAAQPHLNANQVKGMRVICPPLALQQQFAEKIQAIEAQKELVKQSIAETQQLLASRMDYYFD